ncbi:hypothetical protein GOV04_05105 [Candidatus Woesearchaeota archaeon]|nr:hypothetical protein [Candidatus Woesearchaeota archaeon]
MKRAFLTILSITLLFSLVGCDSSLKVQCCQECIDAANEQIPNMDLEGRNTDNLNCYAFIDYNSDQCAEYFTEKFNPEGKTHNSISLGECKATS